MWFIECSITNRMGVSKILIFTLMLAGCQCESVFNEQKHKDEEACSKNEKTEFANEKMIQLEKTIANMQQQLTASSVTITNLQQQVMTSSKAVEVLSDTLTKYTSSDQDSRDKSDFGVNYIRYGHKSCPDTAKVLYGGFVGKSFFNPKDQPGGGSNYLCLPEKPEWPKGAVREHQSHSYVFGVEYRAESPLMEDSLHNNDVPCTVCEVTKRSQKIMIPAKLTCPKGWVKEYSGLLMAEHSVWSKSDYVCVDSAMEVITGGGENKEGGLLHVVEAVCGSLTCPPYIQGYEIACVVCTK